MAKRLKKRNKKVPEKYEIVYVLRNEAMPGLIKIGITQRADIESRMKELYSTGVPLPFECLWAGEFCDCRKIEKIVHNAFADMRVNQSREFFKLAPERVTPLLEELCVKVITSQFDKIMNKSVTKEEQEDLKSYKRKSRPPLNFYEMGIPEGSILDFTKDKNIQVRVVAPKKVEHEGKQYSLTALTMELLQLPYSVQPTGYWSWQGKNLQNIYDETYTFEE